MHRILLLLFTIILSTQSLQGAQQYVSVSDFTNPELKQIAHAILAAPHTLQIPGTQNPGPLINKMNSHTNAHVGHTNQGALQNGTSFFRLNNHNQATYLTLLGDVVTNGTVVTDH